jgi:hypothetical protein
VTASDREYQEALAYVRAKLALPKSEREKWLNEIVDMWIANRRARRHRKNTR